eukprot:scaffold132686_cov42-Phaeocystis_antarctica.AAC.1
MLCVSTVAVAVTAVAVAASAVAAAVALAAAPVRGSRSMRLPLRSNHRALVSFGRTAHCKLLPWP